MKKTRIVAIIMILALLITTATLTTFSASSDYVNALDYEFTQRHGKDGVLVTQSLTTGSAIVMVSTIAISYDNTIFDLIDETTGNAIDTSSGYIDNANITTPPSFFTLNTLTSKTTGNITTVEFSRADFAPPATGTLPTKTALGSVFLALKSGYTVNNIPVNSIRLSTVSEISTNVTDPIYITESDGLTSHNSSTLAAPAVSVEGFTFALPAYSGTQATAPVAAKSDRTTVTITPQTISDEVVEYAISADGNNSLPTTGWQTSTTFSNIAPGTYYFFARVKAKDTVHTGGSPIISAATTTIYSSPEISYSNVPTAPTVDTNFNITAAITGGTGTGAATAFTVTTGTLPAGLTINATSGAITGKATATTTADTQIIVTYTDSEGNTDTANITIPPIAGSTSPMNITLWNDDPNLPLNTNLYGDVIRLKANHSGDKGTAGESYAWSASDPSVVTLTPDASGQIVDVVIIKPTTTPVTITVNYTSNTHTGTATTAGFTFATRPLILTADVTSKTYDGNTTANLTNAAITGQANINSTPDGTAEIALSSTTGVGAFTDQYVGGGKAVTVANNAFTLTGTKAAYYHIVTPTGLVGNITSADQILITTYTDASTAYNLLKDGGTVSLSQLVSGAQGTLSGSLVSPPSSVTLSGTDISTSGGTTGETFSVEISASTHDAGGDPANEYNSTAAPTTVYIKLVDKLSNTTDMTVTLPNITFGGTLAPSASTPTVATGETLTAPVYTYFDSSSALLAAPPSDVGSYKVRATRETESTIYTAEANFTIDPKDISSATINLDSSVLTYNGNPQTKTISSVLDGATPLVVGTDYTINAGTNVGTDAGQYTITITGTNNYTGSKTASFSIEKLAITPTDAVVSKIFDGKNTATASSVTFSGVPAAPAVQPSATDYTATGTYDTIDVSSTKTATLTVSLKAGTAAATNYKLSTPTLIVNNAVITEKTIVDKTVTIPILWNNTDTQTVSFASSIPSDAGALTYGTITPLDPDLIADSITINPTNTVDFTLVSGLDEVTDKGKTISFSVTIDSLNYADFNITVVYEITDYIAPTVVPGTGPAPQAPVYIATETVNNVVTISAGGTATFTFPMPADQYAGIWIDGIARDPNEVADISFGSVIVKLKSSFTRTLANGEHTIHVVGKDGSFGFAKFYIGGHSNPQTSAE